MFLLMMSKPCKRQLINYQYHLAQNSAIVKQQFKKSAEIETKLRYHPTWNLQERFSEEYVGSPRQEIFYRDQ